MSGNVDETGREESRDWNDKYSSGSDTNGVSDGGKLAHRKKKTSAPSSTLKTPMAFLNEICTKSGSTISLQMEENKCASSPSGLLFQCRLELLRLNGIKIEGIGIASNKQNSKQEAARALLLKLDPHVESMLTPRYSCDSDVRNSIGKNGSNSVRGQGYSTVDCEQAKGTTEIGGDLVTIKSADGTVSVTVPKSLVVEQQPDILKEDGNATAAASSSKTFNSMKRTADIVRAWDGPTIEHLQNMTAKEILELNMSFRIVEKISEEQGLSATFIRATPKDSEDMHTCILEVSSQESPSDPSNQNEIFYLTQAGFGETPQDAVEKAAQNYLLMIRAILVAG